MNAFGANSATSRANANYWLETYGLEMVPGSQQGSGVHDYAVHAI